MFGLWLIIDVMIFVSCSSIYMLCVCVCVCVCCHGYLSSTDLLLPEPFQGHDEHIVGIFNLERDNVLYYTTLQPSTAQYSVAQYSTV